MIVIPDLTKSKPSNRRSRWAGHLPTIKEDRKSFGIVMSWPGRRKSIIRLNDRWVDNVATCLVERDGRESGNRIQVKGW